MNDGGAEKIVSRISHTNTYGKPGDVSVSGDIVFKMCMFISETGEGVGNDVRGTLVVDDANIIALQFNQPTSWVVVRLVVVQKVN